MFDVMGWYDGPERWRDFERQLSWRPRPRPLLPQPDASDATPALVQPVSATPWAELHVHTAYSFLDGADAPDVLVAEAVRLGVAG